MLQIGFKRLSENAILPTKAHATDSGFDLFAAEEVLIPAGGTAVIATDIAVVLPKGYEAQIRPRSGLTSKTTFRVQLGTIDNTYRGPLGVIGDNIEQRVYFSAPRFMAPIHAADNDFNIVKSSSGGYIVRKGEKIAQLVVQPIPTAVAYEILGDLDETERGANGFGSTGV